MRLLTLLFLMFVVTPFVELALLFQIAEHIGGLETLGLVIVTGVVGSLLAKSQGFRVWN
ncbi:MAG TPA: FxsA family protein, partial [Planctomycetaceae bacterium]|nr:FxsA family protein [Planctomycetaceae bacterium]